MNKYFGLYLLLYFYLRARFSVKLKVQCGGTGRVLLLKYHQGAAK